MTKIIAVANQKGGVGKTTCTYNLAVAKAQLIGEKREVLMIDFDPQGNLTTMAGYVPEGIKDTIAEVLTGTIKPDDACYEASKCGLKNLSIVPANLVLAEVENWLYTMRNPDVQLRKATQQWRRFFDYIFIDCAPQLGRLLSNALVAADEVIIPVKTDYLPYRGLKQLYKTIKEIKEADGDRSLNPVLSVKGIIATMFKARSKDNQQILDLLQKEYPVIGVIKDSVSAIKGTDDGKCCVVLEPKSETAQTFFDIAAKL